MDGEAFDESAASHAEWLLDRQLDVAAEVYGPEQPGLHTPVDQLSDVELLERFMDVNGFDLHVE